MKLVKVFALFVVLHLVGWGLAHGYRSANPDEVLVVIDTSHAMQAHFPDMQRWLDNYESGARYKTIRVGTDKADLGNLADFKSKEALFRTVFGKMTEDNLRRYDGSSATEKILLSDGSVNAPGWDVVTF